MPKNILITGAAGHLGNVVCDTFLKQGHTVIGTTSPNGKPNNDKVDFHACDLTDETDTKSLFTTLQINYEQLDAVICLVGGFDMSNIQNTSSAQLMKMLNMNFMSAFHTAQNSINWMNETGGGDIIFIGAKPAIEGNASETLPYAIAKFSVIKLAEIINEDKNLKNIRASVIVPSVIDTLPNRQAMPNANFADWVTPGAIAESISFLLSAQGKSLRKPILKLYNNA